MTRDQFREWTLREPFVPFVIVTKDRKRYRIPDYGYVLVRLASIFIKNAGHPFDFDLPLVQIDRCEPIPAKRRRPRRPKRA